MRTAKILVALLAYGVGIVWLGAVGGPLSEEVWAVVSAGRDWLGTVLAGGALAVLAWATSSGAVLAAVAPLFLLAVVSVVGLIVWPATVDHVPVADDGGADVVELPQRSPRELERRAA